jgi:hypothetical protein
MVHQFPVRWAFDHFANISSGIAAVPCGAFRPIASVHLEASAI